MCPGTAISATVQPIVVKFCMTVELCPGQIFSPFGGDIFKGFQMLGQKYFGQPVFGVTSSLSVINKTHRCVARRRLLLARYGRRTRAIICIGRSKCWWHAAVQQWSMPKQGRRRGWVQNKIRERSRRIFFSYFLLFQTWGYKQANISRGLLDILKFVVWLSH